ncbi:MAG: alpha/beta hydrolase [Pseudomonadota bacterium]
MPDAGSPSNPVRFSVALKEGDLAGWRWENSDAPALLFCHATGFCASAYKQMLRHLSNEFDIYALDMRGHGGASLPADPGRLRSWRVYASDVVAFLETQPKQKWVLAGHSMGAIAAALAAKRRSDITALALIEPVVIPPLVALAARAPFWRFIGRRSPMARRAAQRRSQWPGQAEVMKSYAGKAVFSNWADGVLADYLEDGLRGEAAGDGVTLACHPDWEAATFTALDTKFSSAVRGHAVPVSVFAGRLDNTTVLKSARRRCLRWGVSLTESASLSHLAPMEDPAECADFIRGAGQISVISRKPG